MLAANDFLEFLSRIDNDFIGVVMILTTVGTFSTIIISVIVVFNTLNNLVATRMNHSLTKSLLAKGYSVDEVERLVHGQPNWSRRIGSVVRRASNELGRLSHRMRGANHPAPPVKQPTV